MGIHNTAWGIVSLTVHLNLNMYDKSKCAFTSEQKYDKMLNLFNRSEIN